MKKITGMIIALLMVVTSAHAITTMTVVIPEETKHIDQQEIDHQQKFQTALEEMEKQHLRLEKEEINKLDK